MSGLGSEQMREIEWFPAQGDPSKTTPDRIHLKSAFSVDAVSLKKYRPADHAGENRILIALAREMNSSSCDILKTLAETALTLCHAHSAGVSLLSEDRTKFYWPAVAGEWASHAGAGTPRDFGPCGTVLDQNAPLVFSHPENDFPYLATVRPGVEEA